MSAWKNAVRRREHRERPQPEWRAKRGILEKKKDYKQRALNFQGKEKRLKALTRRAAERNPDEFYFKMTGAKTTKGKHVVEQARGDLTGDMLKLLKSQDAAYVTTTEIAEGKKVERMSSALHFLDGEARGKHTLFFDDEKAVAEFDAAKFFGTAPELVGRAYNRPRKETLAEERLVGDVDRKSLKKARRKRDRAYEELGERIDRARKLRTAREHLDTQKHLMTKGRRTKVKDAEDGKPAVFKWAKVRKR